MTNPTLPTKLPPQLARLRERIEQRATALQESVASVREQLHGGLLCAVLDVSGSMSGEPIEEARRGLLDMAAKCAQGGFHIGLVAFDSAAHEVRAVGAFDDSYIRAVAGLSAGGGTMMAGAIDLGRRLLGDRGRRVMLVVSDGMPGDADEAVATAEIAKRAGVQIWTIGTAGANQSLLDRIASGPAEATFVRQAQLRTAIADTAGRLLLPGRR